MSHAKAVSPGHKYDLLNHEDPIRTDPQRIIFIRKRPAEDGSGRLVTVHNGTTNEAVIQMLIHRINYLNEKLPSDHNEKAISLLREALASLEKRTAEREKAGVEGTLKDLEGNLPETEDQLDRESEIPEDMPWDKYLRDRNGLTTIGEVEDHLKGDGLAGLKYMNEEREQDVAAWLAENLE